MIIRHIGVPKVGGAARLQPLPQSKIKKKKTHTGFVDTMIPKVLCDLHFGIIQPLKSFDERYIGILKKNVMQIHEFVNISFSVRVILFVT